MARRDISRKKLVIVGCTCGFFIYLLLVRRLVPRLSSPLVSLATDGSNRLDEQLHTLSNTRQALSENIPQQHKQQHKQQHVHLQQLGENRHSQEQEQHHIQNHQQQQEQQQNHHLLLQEQQAQKEQQHDYHLLSLHQQHLDEQQQQQQYQKEQKQHRHPQQQQYQKEEQQVRNPVSQQHQKEQQQQNHPHQQQPKQTQQMHENQLSRRTMQADDTMHQRATSKTDVLTKPQRVHNVNVVEQTDSRRKDSDIIWINKAMKQNSYKIKHPDDTKRIDTGTKVVPPLLAERTPSNGSSLVIASDGFVRNCLTGDVIGHQSTPVSKGPLKVRDDDSPEDTNLRVQSFQKVFDTRAWGHSWDQAYRGVNASGRGATLLWTQEFTATLHRIVSEVRAVRGLSRVRLLDVPCGDMAWMSRFLRTRDDIDYTGVDIVPSLIDHHRKEYGRFGWKFIAGDVVQNGINDTYDIIVNRMMLQHLYFNDVIRLLAAFSNSGSDYLLATTFAAHAPNEELRVGDDGKNPGRFRKLNLEIEPVSLEAPLCIQRDGPPDDFEGWNHFVALWRLPLKRIRWCTTAKPFPLKGTSRTLYSCAPWSY